MPNRQHTRRITPSHYTCEGCKQIFPLTFKQRQKGKGRFCSTECRRKPREIHICKTCNQEFPFLPTPSKTKRGGKGNFCSARCMNDYTVTVDPADRFWSKVSKSPGQGPDGDCWEWEEGKTDAGYGQFRINKKIGSELAHRYSFLLAYGYMAEDVCHRCDNPSCVRPKHLFGGTAKANAEDRQAKGRGVRGERQHSAKLTEIQVRSIFYRVAWGESQASIARDLRVSENTIYRVLKGKTWAYLGLTKKAA